MEKNEGKKTITIKQGTGDDAIEMNVLGSQEELDMMEQLRQNNPEKWTGKDLELLQEARKVINTKQHDVSCDNVHNEKKEETHNVFIRPSKRGMVLVKVLWSLLIIYKFCLMFMQYEVKNFEELLLTPEYSSLHGREFLEITQDDLFFIKHKGLNEFWGTGKDFVEGIKDADYYHLVPFNRMITASLVLNVKNKFLKNKPLKRGEQFVLETKVLDVESSYLKASIYPKWKKFGESMPVIIEVVIWLFLAYLSVRKYGRTEK